jgi:hypothetical protein
MADGAIYEVQMSQRGLIPRAVNPAATMAIERRRAGARSGEIYGSNTDAPSFRTPQPN